ncbi:mannitol dehydrogenase family protein [Protaetiibacter larvae]|nr:mannitol dehydrogenase family protein [Protaetiibacter larvae]
MSEPVPRLTRAALARAGEPLEAAPARIVHLGVGAFHRAHQAWYTSRAPDAADWGIAAFTARTDAVARRLAPQDGVYTLVERGPEADRFEHIGSIVEVHPATRTDRLRELVAAPSTAVATLTITEAGYHLRPDGVLDLADVEIAHDVEALRGGRFDALLTPLARLLLGLADRRTDGVEPIAIVSCDNLPDNGARLAAALAVLASETGRTGALQAASFVNTSVDRITPRTTEADLEAIAEATGWRDEAPAVTEPFADWTLSGEFPSGHPAWDAAGARFVGDIRAHTQRKLLVLNGGHLVLAFEGLRRGLATVADAIADRDCRRALERFWDEAARTVGSPDTDAYRAALEERFANRRIEHPLAQIAVDTVTKLSLRVLPVIRAERAAGRDAAGSTAVVAAWAACRTAGLLPGERSDRGEFDRALDTLLEGADPRDGEAIVAAVTPPG